MTDKLADAKRALLKISVEADHIYSDEIEAIDSFITEHEATKAATPDDVREAVKYLTENADRGTLVDKHIETLINAALRQQRGVPIEVLEDANQICRSAYQIAARGGGDTNWPAFASRIEKELDRQAKALALLNAQGV